jgi:hypothetical protein
VAATFLCAIHSDATALQQLRNIGATALQQRCNSAATALQQRCNSAATVDTIKYMQIHSDPLCSVTHV